MQRRSDLRAWWTYVRLRPRGRAIAMAWPQLTLEEYRWCTVLDVPGARRRLYRVCIEALDLRTLLTAYLPDELIPDGSELDVETEARYLHRGLQHDQLRPRNKAGDPAKLPPMPEGIEETERFLLRVWGAMGRLGKLE